MPKVPIGRLCDICPFHKDLVKRVREQRPDVNPITLLAAYLSMEEDNSRLREALVQVGTLPDCQPGGRFSMQWAKIRELVAKEGE